MLDRLPADIQNGVCSQDIKIHDRLYDIFWDDGSWFYIYASQTLTTAQNADPNKVFTKCNAKTSSSSSSGSPDPTGSQPSQTETEESSGIGTGAIAGIAAGIAVLAIAGVLGAFFFLRRRKRKGYVNASGIIIDDDDDDDDSRADTHVGALEPYTYTSTTPSQPTMTNTGSYFPASTIGYNSSQPDDSASQHHASGTSSSRSGQGSSTGYVVSNPDSGSSARPEKGYIDASQSPRSPPPMVPLPAKGAAPNARMTYVPPAPSEADASERHVDAGPMEGGSLQRNTSGRLPPAYGDLI
ncbi:hypothetical protein PQX77_011564 [Marasmius sp. AFHP31]|nr:hypothetical protein PQX77_011564 [Marasmius sp. AFHP31]